MADSSKFGISEKLNHNNYSTWSFEMKMFLCRDDLWKYVEDAIPAENLQDNVWKRGNSKALATISLGCETSQFSLVRNQIFARNAWRELKNYHEKRTVLSMITLIKKVVNKKLEEGGDMARHIQEFDDIFMQMDAVELKFSEIFKVVFVLASLPDSYETLVMSLEARSDDELTMGYVKQKLLDEFGRKKQKESTVGEKMMFSRDRKVIRQRTDEKRCFVCGQMGHLSYIHRQDANKKFVGNSERAKMSREENEKQETENVKFVCEEDEDKEIVFAVSTRKMENEWYLDSGCTRHMTNMINFYSHIVPNKSKVIMANGVSVLNSGNGDGVINCVANNNEEKLKLDDVLLVPELETSLISISKLVRNDMIVVFDNDGAAVYNKNDELVAEAEHTGGLFKLKKKETVLLTKHDEHEENCQHQWHRRFGHRDPKVFDIIRNEQLADGFKIMDCGIRSSCECCIECKLSKKPFPKHSLSTTKSILDLIHTDLCGPVTPTSVGNNVYIMTLIDDFSRFTRIYLLQRKSEAAEKIKSFVAEMVTQFGKKPKVIRSDRGGEYTGKALLEFYEKEGIIAQFTIPANPQQNGVAERKNRTLIEMTRCLLRDANLDKSLWGEAIHTANYLQNRLPTRSVSKTPFEFWYGFKPDYSNLKVFGCKAWVHIPREKRKKLDSVAMNVLFVGYCYNQKGYRFYDEINKRIVTSRDARFLELSDGTDQNEKEVQLKNTNIVKQTLQIPVSEEQDSTVVIQEEIMIQEENLVNQSNETSETADQMEIRRSSRSNKGIAPRYLTENYIVGFAQHNIQDPVSYEEAIHGNESKEWYEAMTMEYESLAKNETWELVDLPKGYNLVGCKWVFKRKEDENGNPTIYKARLVAQGFSQKYGIDYDEVFAPVIKSSTMRILLTVAGHENLVVRHVDIKTAFLNGELTEEIYMSQPKGFVDQEQLNKVCRLKKSLYGLKQSARSWNKKLNEVLLGLGFEQSIHDECLYEAKIQGAKIFILVHVDDMMIVGKSEEQILFVEKLLSKRFDVTCLGNLKHFLGMKIERKSSGIFCISQESYIKKVLMKYGMADAKPSKIPLDISYGNTVDESRNLDSNDLYRSVIGSLLYLSVNTRPDIAAATSILSRKISQPTERDWNEAKRLLRYLKYTMNDKLVLGKRLDEEANLIVYVDADWAGNISDRKSNSGFAFQFKGALVDWSCRKQTCVSLSSTEAEYISLSEACQEMMHIQRLLVDLGYGDKIPIIREDNQSCIKLVIGDRIGRRSKHIDTRFHFVKDLYRQSFMKLEYCPTEVMLADVLTKPLCSEKLNRFKQMMGVLSSKNIEEEC